jgi:glucarate dehydratase
MYMMTATHRTVIQFETDQGLVGLGETLGTEDVYRLTVNLAERWLGRDPLDRRALSRSFARSVFDNRNGRNGWSAYGGLELAAWDLAGQASGLPVADLLGGAGRREIEVVCPVPAVITARALDRVELLEHLARTENAALVGQYAALQAERFGFRCFKYKSAGISTAWDVAAMTALRTALGPDAQLRFDPNAAYPPAQAIALGRRLEPLRLEFLEDPTDDQEGLAAVRAAVATPVATNMCLVQIDQLAPAVRRRAVDVVLADVYMWGGIERLRSMVWAATLCGLEVGIHSLFETGIGTAVNLHLAAALPELRRANDSGLHVLERDVVQGSPGRVRDGRMTLPDGAGWGVTLDETALQELTVDDEVVSR